MVASAGDKPRFRQDLVAEPIEDGQARFIDVADPDTGALFRFYEVEYSLACAMDGERDVNGIVQWAKEELGLAASAKEVQNVIATLRDLGYLERGAAAAAAAMPAAAAKEAPKPAATPSGVKAPAGKPSVNKWDQPTAMGDADEYLEPGVVVPKGAARAPAADDLELGQAGATSAKVETDLPRAADLELGAPGAAAAPANRPAVPKTSDVQLGTAGRSDVSIDLAAHMPVGAEDVKEAVRQSQVMKAVDVPKELLEAAEAAPASKKAEAKAEKKAETKAEKRAEAKAERKAEADRKLEAERKAEADKKADADKKAEAKAEVKADKKAEAKAEAKAEKKPEAKAEKKPAPKAAAVGKPAVEAPKRDAEKRPVAPPAPKAGTSPVLIAMFVIVLLAAGGFLAYRYLFKAKTGTQTSAIPVQTKPPEPPAPPPVETQKLATEQQDPIDLKAASAGQIETIVANDTAVKTGDAIAQLAGHKGLDAEVAAMQKDIDTRVKPELDKAQKDRDAAQTAGNKAAVTAAEARIADRTKSLDDKEAKLATKQAEQAKLQIKAPADGKVTTVAKASAKVAAGDVVAKLTRSPVLTATFKTASGVTPQSHVLLATTSGGQKLSCTVVTADASGVKVACPGDVATDGTEVTFAGVDPNAPAGEGSGEIEMGDEGSAASEPPGSAAGTPETGSAAAPAAGSAAAGSAASAAAPSPHATPAKAPARAPVHHAPAKAPAKAPTPPADKPAEQPAEPAEKPADKPAEAPAPAPAPAAGTGDTLK